ncbi:MAG: hypothetical protein ACR2ND_10425 [Solirubrobacteraceae bacterium]
MRPQLQIGLALAAAAALAAPNAPSAAATRTYGSDLSAPATLDTSILQPPGHNGSDTFVWNTQLASRGDPRSPADGQVTDIKLKGCTNASRGPVPGFDDTGIEFQDLAPQPDGSLVTPSSRTATGNAAGQHFELPLCDTAGGAATASTVTDFQPVNLCTNQGHYINLADNGGFDPVNYPNGVPYQVFGRVPGSNVDSFIVNADGQKSTFRPSDAPPGSGGGFYANPNIELLLQATVADGPDGTGLCAGGTRGGGAGAPAVGPPSGGRTAVRLRPQRDGVNRRGVVKVAIFCELARGCRGIASLSTGAPGTSAAAVLASHSFRIGGRRTSKVPLRLRRAGIAMIRRHHRKLTATLSVTVAGTTSRQLVTLKI